MATTTATATKLTFTVTFATQWIEIAELKPGKHIWICSRCKRAGTVVLGGTTPGATVVVAHFNQVMHCLGETFQVLNSAARLDSLREIPDYALDQVLHLLTQ